MKFRASTCLFLVSSILKFFIGAVADHAFCQYEVWIMDQADSNNGTAQIGYGGYVYIFKSYDLSAPHETINLGAATSKLCFKQTGANPVRPHMLIFNTAGTYGAIAFVASGHVAIIRSEDRMPVACFRTTPGWSGLRQAHAAFPTRDNKYIVIANQNGKKVERINVDWENEQFVHDVSATIALYGNCTTPRGKLCEDPASRPDNAPICASTTADPKNVFVTLRGGGLFVVNYSSTPMQIVGEYDNTTIGSNGCGGVQAGDIMYINSGGGSAANLYEFKVYKLPSGNAYNTSNPPNVPTLKVVVDDSTGQRDAHYAVVTYARDGRPKYFWQPDRYQSVIDVFSVSTDKRVNVIDLQKFNLSSDPTPDAVVMSPVQDHAFISLRGAFPMSADPHVSTGSSPGLAVLSIIGYGRDAVLTRILPITNIVAGVNRADPHGMDVRVTNGACTQVLPSRRARRMLRA